MIGSDGSICGSLDTFYFYPISSLISSHSFANELFFPVGSPSVFSVGLILSNKRVEMCLMLGQIK